MRFAGSSPADLEAAAAALDAGRVPMPPTRVAVERLNLASVEGLCEELLSLSLLGFAASQAAETLRLLAAERRAAPRGRESLELVVTGPDVRSQARDTAVVAEQLFGEATKSVLVVGFALHGGVEIFRRLAERCEEVPQLEVTLCFDISRKGTDTSRDGDLIARFARQFAERHWPSKRLPAVYFDPRGLTMNAAERAVLHAKCIVVDDCGALVTSANPTSAAYSRNVELGLVVREGGIPAAIASHFRSLISAAHLKKLSFPA